MGFTSFPPRGIAAAVLAKNVPPAHFLNAPTSKADNAAMPTGMPSKTGSDYVCQAKHWKESKILG
ncbi:MAG: hypothetical protein IKC02_02780 [Oscillospiraceae bacterium]|nr:hypothetical protein [Oscillospiraceae bacterium]